MNTFLATLTALIAEYRGVIPLEELVDALEEAANALVEEIDGND